MTPYTAPAWLPGGHLQTIYASLFAPAPRVEYRRTRWDTPDGDFIDLDWSEGRDSGAGNQDTEGSPLVVLFHGLEGDSRRHYARTLVHDATTRGCRAVVVHFRGCSGEANRLARAYHSGDSAELDWIVRRLKRMHGTCDLFAVGVSLGGNALLKWLGETGAAAGAIVRRAAAVSAPVDLTAAGAALGRGFGHAYSYNFLVTMKRKSLAKLARYPGLYDPARVRAARTLREFDECVTAPLHGFAGVDDYWTRASSKQWLRHVAVPTLMINARNDPFLPASALPTAGEVSPAIMLEQPEAGGHAGFVSGPPPGHLHWLARRLLDFFGVPDTGRR